jgi:UPF0755 protein
MRRPGVAAAALALLVATVLAAGAAWVRQALYRPSTSVAVELEIPQGMSGREILDRLHARGLLPSKLAGRLYLRAAAADRWLHFGHYRFAAGSRPVDVLERVLDGRIEQLTVTLVEGSSLADVAAQMAAGGIGTEAEWLSVSGRVDWVADLAPEAATLEGFLYPDTYRFAVGIGVADAARHLVERFRSVWSEVGPVEGDPWGTPYDIVTLASMVEAETSVDDERSRIAGVFVNRLRRGMLLQCDPTVVYALERRGEWTGRLLRVHWQVDDPYNTYRYPGLPPGPINSPGAAALRAAAAPEAHEYLYFVASPAGGHVFSTTLKDHNRAVADWRRSRR